MSKPKLLMIVAAKWKGLTELPLDHAEVVVEGRDRYDPEAIDYVMSFTPPPGKIAALPNLKAAFCLGAGVDGFLADPDYPKQVPLVRFVDRTLSAEMATWCGQRRRRWARSISPFRVIILRSRCARCP